MRKIESFNEGWKFCKTSEIPAAFPADWESVALPHTWNSKDGQDGGDDYWRGTACYVKQFAKPQLADQELYFECNGAANTAEVYLNGRKLASHEDGFSTFRVNLTDALQEENLIAVTVDNGKNDHIYPQTADFTFYGGMYRSVNLITVDREHFELAKDGTSGIRVRSEIAGDDAVVTIETWCSGGTDVEYHVGGTVGRTKVVHGKAGALVKLANVHLWNGLKDPYLYTAEAVLLDHGRQVDRIETKFGVRTIEIDPSEGFLLNGEVYPLRGVSRHQDRINAGNAITHAMMEEDMATIKDIGANSVRLAHYQHDQYFYDLCDANGIIVWAEIPYITKNMPAGNANTELLLRELITQSWNHPSIAVWGLSNEITASSPADDEVIANHQRLNALAHDLDPTRLTTMAHVFMLETDSPMTQISDVGAYNLYYGWYLGELQENGEFFDRYHQEHPDRAIGFSEYGADANMALHSEQPERGDYSEEYQCVYHEAVLNCIEARPYLWCSYVWNLFDFGADGRTEGGKAGQNQKGLAAFDHQTKKDAYYLYKAAWSKEPFVHLCGRRYVNRTGSQTAVKVYSNQTSVALYVDGVLKAEQKGKRVFVFTVPIHGKHVIQAAAGSLHDEMTIMHADQPDPAYALSHNGGITNWFEKDDFQEGYFSIKDTMGALQSNPASAEILRQVIAKASASRGAVAKGTENNAALQKMMAKMTLESMLKSAGEKAVPKEAVKQLNAALQKIKKPE